MLDPTRFEVLTFDCYGTLIDWEAGILGELRPVLGAHGVRADDESVLALYAELEPAAERGPHVPYKEVLRRVMRGLAERLGFELAPGEEDAIGRSVGEWRPFPDTVAALRRLQGRYRLAIVSNIDEDLIAQTARRLEVPFGWIVTAERAGAYKPSHSTFRFALREIGVAPERILHVAQSLYHDIAPAKALGLSAVWVDRRAGRLGTGATPPPASPPEGAAAPDLTVPDLATLAERLC